MQKLTGKVLEETGRVSDSIMCCFDIRSGRTYRRVCHSGIVGDCAFFRQVELEWSRWAKDGEEVQSVHRDSFLAWEFELKGKRELLLTAVSQALTESAGGHHISLTLLFPLLMAGEFRLLALVTPIELNIIALENCGVFLTHHKPKMTPQVCKLMLYKFASCLLFVFFSRQGLSM